MATIRSNREFSARIDAAFETQKTRDEAKHRYELDRQELKGAESELCDYAAQHPEVFDGSDAKGSWGETEKVAFTVTGGATVARADGGRLTDADFLDALPPRYVRVKREINKAKLKAEGLDADALAKLGLVQVATRTLKLTAKAA